MGAEKPTIRELTPETPSPAPTQAVKIVLWVLALAAGLGVYFFGEHEGAQLSPKAAEKLQQRLKEIDDSEQYALVAAAPGFYPCLHSGSATFFLKAGEVWKYGVTSKGQFGRYSAVFLARNNVSYVVEFRGNMAECLKQEQIKLFNYPFLPENLARPKEQQLPRPPYNPIMR